MHITGSSLQRVLELGSMVLRPEGSVAGEEWGVKRVEQQLPDFRITGSVPPKVLLVRSQNPEPTEPQASVFA